MRLYHSQTSPFVRTVLLAVHHHGLTEDMETVSLDLFDEVARADFMVRNPLGKIPALELDDGEVIFDSAVIVDYLDQLGNGPGLFDSDEISPHRLKTLYALSNGLLDMAVSSVMELLKRPESERSDTWLARWESAIQTGIDEMAQTLPDIQDTGLIPDYAFAVALDYLAFRLPHIEWRPRHPVLATWLDQRLAEDIFRITDPRH